MVVLRRAPGNRLEGRLSLGWRVLKVALGRSGIKALKREGDGGTPLGRFAFREVLYRADRGSRPSTRLKASTIRPCDGWCEDPRNPNYNKLVKIPADTNADRLTRDDPLYDLVIVLGYNDVPRVRGRGSAIFMHLARPGYTPTAGCIGLSRGDFLTLLRHARPGASLMVVG